MHAETAAAPLPDAEARSRFVNELDRNFSVIAPAGVGKTRSIVDRVVHAATSDPSGALLRSLVVVTYTNKAADEMQQRARNALLATPSGPGLIGAFNRAFFGTIHSFCLSLLRIGGHHLGLPLNVELLEGDDEDALWMDFVRHLSLPLPGSRVTENDMAACLRHLPAQDLLALARRLSPRAPAPRADDPLPAVAADDLLEFTPARPNANVRRHQEALRRWLREFASGQGFLPLPQIENGGEEFVQLAWDTFAPLRDWLTRRSLHLAGGIARAYQAHRIRAGRLTYADMVGLTLDVLRHPEAGAAIRANAYRVILDEAQDTDPDQFNVLLEVARPAPGDGLWTEGHAPAPAAGRFCMVGDPQQSIYAERADLPFYSRVRRRLCDEGAGEELDFHVTFRCSRAVVKAANALCPPMLNGKNGQVRYVRLRPRPDAPAGRVLRLPVRRAPADADAAARPSVDAAAAAEAAAIAAWVAEQGLGGLGLNTWSDMAVLCARRLWVAPIESALRQRNLPVDSHSAKAIQGDDPTYAWMASLAVCLAEPHNGFEIAGVLREVFGLPDTELYDFSRGEGRLFQIETPADGAGRVAETLRFLADVRAAALRLPLLDAAQAIADRTNLEERIAAISPEDERPRIRARLDRLLGAAAAAETEGRSLADWAETLRRGHGTAASREEPRGNAIQLMTCHAAKGLEWDVVLLPLLWRSIADRGSEYPFVGTPAAGGAPAAYFKGWMSANDRERIRARKEQEKQRLLYVALTRARRALILVDDAAWFGPGKGSFADGMGLTSDGQPAAWTGLPETWTPEPASPAATAPAAPAPTDFGPPPTAETVARALAAAQDFPRQVLPSSLARHGSDAEPEAERVQGDTGGPGGRDLARRYGVWWHGLMEQIPWSAPDSWTPVFEAALANCPSPERARREWGLFRDSPTARRLQAAGLVIHTELPFLRPLSPAEVMEGVIDLAAWSPRDNAWILVDWKTDDTTDVERLAAAYAPQLAAYAAAVREACRPDALTVLLYGTVSAREAPIAWEAAQRLQ